MRSTSCSRGVRVSSFEGGGSSLPRLPPLAGWQRSCTLGLKQNWPSWTWRIPSMIVSVSSLLEK